MTMVIQLPVSRIILVGWFGVILIHLNAMMIVTASIATELGTNDGYDVGGTKPICFVSTIPKDPNIPDTDGSNYTAIELLNDGIFNEEARRSASSNVNISLLSSVRLCVCFLGLALHYQLQQNQP
jgi:hypothetical protein